jgi:hypothetical protein
LIDPVKTIRTGEGFDVEGDPLQALEKELEPYRYAKLHQVPTFTGELPLLYTEIQLIVRGSSRFHHIRLDQPL